MSRAILQSSAQSIWVFDQTSWEID